MRQRVPDIGKAKSLIASAKKDYEFTLTLKVNDNSANTIIRNIYECFRMLGEAILTTKGIDFTDHIECINELINIDIKSERPSQILDYLRKTRHRINYDGYIAKKEEAEEIISIGKDFFIKLYNEIEKGLK
jgi:uncharacterized protein (UPF0332 family)